MQIQLKQPFAGDSPADEYDVRQIKHALNRLGYYMPYEKVGMTEIPDTQVFQSLKNFQDDHGLPPTGTAKPDDDTIKRLNAELLKDPKGAYIWRTVKDDKVRSSHARLEGTIRSWSQSPDPTDDYNCRCWAEPLENQNEIYDPPIKPVYPELFLIPAIRAKSVLNLLELSASRIIRDINQPKIKMSDTRTWPRPPVSGKFKEGRPSRQKPHLRGEKSLYDGKNGEWRYAKEDEYHNPHWDYKRTPSSSWENVSINSKPTNKNGK